MAFSTSLFAQNNNLLSQSIQFIGSSFMIRETNPMEKPESDSINGILQTSLKEHINKQAGLSKKILCIFDVLYKNGESLYSDSQEEIRAKLRRSACFASIALLSNIEKGFTFIEYAKFALSNDINNPQIEFIEEPYLGLLFIEVTLKYEDNQLSMEDLTKVFDFVNLHRDNLSTDMANQATVLLEAFKEKL